MKKFFKQFRELFNSLSLNLQIVALTIVMGIAGGSYGGYLLYTTMKAGWITKVFRPNYLEGQEFKAWFIIGLSVISLAVATYFYLQEEKMYKRIFKKIKDAQNQINKEDAVDVDAIPV
jgi:hypothetical protein